ncbi:MAG: hypothetical protein HZA22_12400 [Nitrospirae bacterium]|nr:hypothetical protein [Nitrospirota bacterium]
MHELIKYNIEVVPAVLGVIGGIILSLIAMNKHFSRARREGFRPKVFPDYNADERKYEYLAFISAGIGMMIALFILWLKGELRW